MALCEDRMHQTLVVYHPFPITTQCILQWQFDVYPRMFSHVQSPWPIGYIIWSIKIHWNPMKVPFKLHPYVFLVFTVPMLIDKHPMKCHESPIFWHVWLKSLGAAGASWGLFPVAGWGDCCSHADFPAGGGDNSCTCSLFMFHWWLVGGLEHVLIFHRLGTIIPFD